MYSCLVFVLKYSAFLLLLLDLTFQTWREGLWVTCFMRFKYLNSWALSLSLLYFYWTISFEPFQPTIRKKYSKFLLNLHALNLTLHLIVCVVYWLFLHESEFVLRVDCFPVFLFRHFGVCIFVILDFLLNDIPIKLDSRKFILPTILCYLLTNLYFTISQGKPVYSIITWTDWKTPLVFLGCVFGMYGSFYFWFLITKKIGNKIKSD